LGYERFELSKDIDLDDYSFAICTSGGRVAYVNAALKWHVYTFLCQQRSGGDGGFTLRVRLLRFMFLEGLYDGYS